MFFWIVLALILLIAFIFLQIKYGKPLYDYKCLYSYSRFGKKGEYFTEILQAKENSHSNQQEHKESKQCSEVLSVKKEKKQELVFLFLSGNPGYIRFYDRFLQHLYEVYSGHYDVFGIGQAGQSLHDSTYHRYFNLSEQVEHKVLFFNSLVQQEKYKNSKFVLIGHSFGCYTALKLMQSIDQSKIMHILMIHPAFDRLVDTPNGKNRMELHKYSLFTNFILKVVDFVVPITILRMMCLINFKGERYEKGEGIEDCAETLAQWLRYDTAHSFLTLTLHQFQEIRDLDEKEILQLADKLTLYYAENDDWTPEYQKQHFKDSYGHKVRCLEDEMKMGHVFVAGGSLIMAQKIKELLENRI